MRYYFLNNRKSLDFALLFFFVIHKRIGCTSAGSDVNDFVQSRSSDLLRVRQQSSQAKCAFAITRPARLSCNGNSLLQNSHVAAKVWGDLGRDGPSLGRDVDVSCITVDE